MINPTFRLEYEKRGHGILARLFASHDGSEPRFVSRLTLPAWVFYLFVQALQVGGALMTPRIEIAFVKVEGMALRPAAGERG